MLYDVSLTIPASTLKASATTLQVELTYGVIHRVEIEFPSGCAGLAHFAIDIGEHQVWPTNPEGSFRSDDHIIAWNEYFPLFVAPYILRLRGWNEDDTFHHTITARIGLLPPEALADRMQNQNVLNQLRAAFGLEV